jgi:hypothetical protein
MVCLLVCSLGKEGLCGGVLGVVVRVEEVLYVVLKELGLVDLGDILVIKRWKKGI